jgi:hypothetical protein
VARHEDFAGLAKKHSNANCKSDISVVSPDDISESTKKKCAEAAL